MKKQKRILTAILAVTLITQGMPVSIIETSASETEQNAKIDEEIYSDETTDIIEDSAEAETGSAELSELSNEIEEAPEANSASVDVGDTGSSEIDSADGFMSGDDQDNNSSADGISDINDQDVRDSAFSSGTADVSDENSSKESEEFVDDFEAETFSAEQDENEIAVQDTTDDTLSITRFVSYNNGTITVKSAEELILLSNCAPRDLQNLNIILNITGESDITQANNIKKDTPVGSILKAENETASVSTEENLPEEEMENPQLDGDTESENSLEEAEQDTTADAEAERTDLQEVSQSDEAVQTEEVVAKRDYTFRGIGTVDVPFEGTIKGSSILLSIDNTFFGGLSSKAKITLTNSDSGEANSNLSLIWCGDGTKPMVAGVYQFDDSTNDTSGHTLPVEVTCGTSASAAGSLLGTVKASSETFKNEILNIGSKAISYGQTVINISSANAGAICNILEAGTICLNGYNFPSGSCTIQSAAEYTDTKNAMADSGNAGGLIGVMKSGTTLEIKSNVKMLANSKITSSAGNAGGLVGLMMSGAKINIDTGATMKLISPTITGGTSAGGVAGTAYNAIFEGPADALEVSSSTIKGDTSTSNAGGFIGHYILSASDSEGSFSFPESIEIKEPTVSTDNGGGNFGGNSGGYFGYLEFDGVVTYQINTTGSAEPKKISSTHGAVSKEGNSYGAIAGKVTSNTIKSTLKISNLEIQSFYKNNVIFHGGVIGELGASGKSEMATYLDVSNVEVIVQNPYADNGKVGFGGIVGCLSKGSILKISEKIKVSTIEGTDPYIWQGGGIIGRAEAKSVLEFSGTTDLSDAQYAGSRSNVGWLVGYQENALIYARGDGNGNGWKYLRGDDTKYNGQVVNDIANYGQIIRLRNNNASGLNADLIQINDEHRVVLNNSKNLTWTSSEEITLSSAEEFALLSIAWNSRGNFSAISNITEETWSKLKNTTIILNADIDLAGTGIIGLSRDTANDTNDVYSGKLDGKNHRITLAIGEPFGYKQKVKDSVGLNGGGEMCATGNYHAAQGLFAKTGESTIQNLVIDGNIYISNIGSEITGGGIAAFTSSEQATVKAVTVKECIIADCAKNQTLSVGGLYGAESGGKLTLEGDTKVYSTIQLSNGTQTGSYAYAGGVLGQITTDTFKLAVNGLFVGGDSADDVGKIITDATEYAYVGGLVGIIKPRNLNDSTVTENRWMEIWSLTFNNFLIEADKATKVCGGLFGSIWSNVGVYFMTESDSVVGAYENTKLIVQNSSINAPKAAGVGGLAYRSSGIWEIRDKGIDIRNMSIAAGGDVGLLVCRGEKGTATINGSEAKLGALYLNTTEYWGNSYILAEDNNISITQTSGVFDEFVAHTTDVASSITDNEKNGVISLATNVQDNKRIGVAEQGANCTTYQNRTAYGKEHQTNACSRYYYDLDQCLEDVKKSSYNNGWIDTEQELLLWSVYRYAYTNIQKFFGEKDNVQLEDIKNVTLIGAENENSSLELNMEKYSYYPINIGSSIIVKNTTFKFYNQQIEEAETSVGNKSTQLGTDSNTTQHYTMHCGLFLNQTAGDTTVSLDTVTFNGSIGKVGGNASGVLFAGNVTGSASDNNLSIANISLKGITFDGLTVNKCDENYAPLLINSMGSYVKLAADDIKIAKNSYNNLKTAAASSLIGTVGGNNGKQITLSFLNIVLPDKRYGSEGGIFSHASLLESFVHDGSSSVATYNFYRKEEWTDDRSYTHGVTYGKEITETVEYVDMQLWYYDEINHDDDTNRVHTTSDDLTKFSSKEYLPYVCQEYMYTGNNCNHEIKVNQRVADILSGCGTYSHPYKITSDREMTILSEYMATGTARTDWRVTITGDQSTYHVGDETYTSSKDKIYQFKNNEWVQVKRGEDDAWDDVLDDNGAQITLQNDFILQYLLNAYYDLQGTEVKQENQSTHLLKLTNFGGFGISTRPFRGVLTSTTNTIIVLSGTGTSNGLIPYSYGSVVKNLTIQYNKTDEDTGKTLTYTDTKTSPYYPDVCFGGVIGCVLGGDNIIDNVTVEIAESWLTLDGDKKYLIQVGGYVGSVCGGGVILRNMTKTATGLSSKNIANEEIDAVETDNDYSFMYVNPYVGRVLDGFVFYEKTVEDPEEDTSTVVSSLENTNKNYYINSLDPIKNSACVTVNDDSVIANDATGMLVLSAIINSGASSKGASNAYSSIANGVNETKVGDKTYNLGGKYGKARSAAYSAIGKKPDETEMQLSQADDRIKPGTDCLPYLISKYCGKGENLFKLSSVNISLKKNTPSVDFDMTAFKSGYQGLTGRYASSAIMSGEGVDAGGVVPELFSFNGNDNTLTLDVQVNEYVDDDFHAASVGGVFNLLRVGTKEGTVSDLTIDGVNVSLVYYGTDGKSTKDTSNVLYKESIGVGGFAGATSSLSATSDFYASVEYNNVSVKNLTVSGPQNAGGLLGSSKNSVKDNKDDQAAGIALMLEPNYNTASVGTVITNSVLDSITVVAPNAVGGFVGYIDNGSTNSLSTKSTDTDTVTTEFIVGDNLTIGKKENIPTYAGGAFGYVKASNLYVNAGSSGAMNGTMDSVIQESGIIASQYAGGFIGGIESTCSSHINDAVIKNDGKKSTEISVVASDRSNQYLGGIVGYAAGKSCKIENSKTISAVLNTTDNSDTSVSGGTGGIIGRTAANENSIDSCNVEQTTLTSGKTGGIVGSTSASVTIQNCTVSGNADAKAEITGQQTAGGILGLSTASGAKISINQCKVSYVKTTSSEWGCGGLLGDVDWDAGLDTLYLFDNVIEHTEIVGNGNNTTAGGFVGDIRGNLNASNLLLNDVTIHASLSNKTGMVIGLTDDRTGKIAVAGLSIQNTTGFSGAELKEDNTNAVSQLYGVIDNRDDVKTAIKKKSYFAFADYTGSSLNNKPGENLLGDEAKAPYVVTSPESSLSVCESIGETAESKSLYGDGASWSSDDNNKNFTVNAEKIWENRLSAKGGHYAYGNIPAGEEEDAVTDFQFSSVISTYKTNQTDSSSMNNLSDFPVVQITAGNADIVKDYLNILTNGGFSAANTQNTSTNIHVSAETAVYVYKDNNFVKASETKEAPSFQVTTDSNNKISFSTTTEYDNNRNRFTLLTVTFAEKDAGDQLHYYKVLVPILVRRMFEIDFTATLTYGTDFNKVDYVGLSSHVLESSGSSITGYLTYTYDSIEGEYAEYGWESYINAGGNVVDSMTKSIRFVTAVEKLPTGMQLTLVDTITGKAYYYTATGKEEKTTAGNSGFDIPLSEFRDSTGATAYKEPSLSELMDITVSSDGENKIFIKVDENGKPDGVEATEGKEFPKPTVKINGEYYRLADSSSRETGEYAISVKEACFEENYYLVITVPQNTSGALNGSIQTTVESKIPHRLHYRKIIGGEDGHENSASTYQLSGGYSQQLKETVNDGNVKKITTTDSMMTVDVTDTITFPKSQSYLGENDPVKDELYLRFVGGLQKTEGSDTSTLQFPRGTSGMANFYVYTETNGTRNYYKYSTDGWIKANNGESAVSYRWTSTGKNMELPLSTDGTTANAISLHQIRDWVKGSETSGDGKFYVQVKLIATFDEDGIEAIPESKTETNGEPSKYVRLTYSSQLSTVSKSLTYSNNRASIVPATTKYYRDQLEIADLTYEADRVDQLGINLLDLQEKYLEDGSKENSCIATTAKYTLSSMKDLVSTLANSESIRFSLQLMQKKNEQGTVGGTNWREDYDAAITNAKEYLGVTVDSKDADSLKYDDTTGTWTWEVKQDKYYDSEQKAIKSDYIFEGNKFRLTQEITLKVNVANVEEKEHFYSNYKVVLTAEILDGKGDPVNDTHQDDNIIYTLAKIAPKFITHNTSESDTNAGN